MDPNEAIMQNKDSDKNKKPWEVPIFLGSVVGLVLFVSRKRAKK
jgi:hypothetical protein